MDLVITISSVVLGTILQLILLLPMQLLAYMLYGITSLLICHNIDMISTDNRQKSENE